MRVPISAVLATSLLALSLTSCAAQPTCTPLAQDGPAVNQVSVTENTNAVPTVTFPQPLTASVTERKVVTAGQGDYATEGKAVSYELALFDGNTGKSLGGTSFNGSDTINASLTKTGQYAFFNKMITCAQAGSTIVSVIPPEDLVDNNGDPIQGISPNMSLIVVADVKSVGLGRADGVPQVVPDGFPMVVLDTDGIPGVTIPKKPAPTTEQIAVLKKGSGPVVTAGATVTVHYSGFLWDTNKKFDSSWDRHSPATFSLDGLVPGFSEALVGQTVGSQILAVIPPDKGYGSQEKSQIPANSTLVFVVDILGVSQ